MPTDVTIALPNGSRGRPSRPRSSPRSPVAQSASRKPARRSGAGVASTSFFALANDFWLEQIVKRGWTSWEIPDVTQPKLSVAWGLIVIAAAALWTFFAWRSRSPPGTGWTASNA